MKFLSYDIVFQEIPDEVTLAINISNCPNCCEDCHSPHLRENTGEELTENVISGLLEKYGNAVTCVCFMGGDCSPEEVLKLACFVRKLPQKNANDAKKHKLAQIKNKSILYIPDYKLYSFCDNLRFLRYLRSEMPKYKTAWYSGNSNFYNNAQKYFDYIKLGAYIKELGGLNSSATNQRFYKIENETITDITEQFYKK